MTDAQGKTRVPLWRDGNGGRRSIPLDALHFSVSATLLVTLLVSAFVIGGKLERQSAILRESFCTSHMAEWSRRTERLNAGWRGADPWAVRAEMELRP